jgi:hypothetical protein
MRYYLLFLVLYGLLKKRRPPGVFFKPFSDSIKLKILLSDLVSLHICLAVFFGLDG